MNKTSLKGKGNRKDESFYDVNEFILEYPTYNNLEYQGMHTHAEKLKKEMRQAELEAVANPSKKNVAPSAEEHMEETRWIAPIGDAGNRMHTCCV